MLRSRDCCVLPRSMKPLRSFRCCSRFRGARFVPHRPDCSCCHRANDLLEALSQRVVYALLLCHPRPIHPSVLACVCWELGGTQAGRDPAAGARQPTGIGETHATPTTCFEARAHATFTYLPGLFSAPAKYATPPPTFFPRGPLERVR